MSERLLMVSHQLPVKIEFKNGHIDVNPREGSFNAGLNYFYKSQNCFWVGGLNLKDEEFSEEKKEALRIKLYENNCFPLFNEKTEVTDEFNVFNNQIIHPVFHYFLQNIEFNQEAWIGYENLNKQYAELIRNIINEGDKIWIHDYHLMLLPKFLRESNPDTSIGYFLHIPFPSYEVFRLLPWRIEILEGLLGADLIGFHTYDYERHFMSCVRRLLGYDTDFNKILLEERIAKVDSFPMGVDYNRFYDAAKKIKKRPEEQKSDLQKEIELFKSQGQNRKILLSIDQLDRSKGLPERLRTYQHFLTKYPEYRENVILLFVLMENSESNDENENLKGEIDELVGKINGEFAVINWTPIWYFFRNLNFDDLTEIFTLSDIAILTPFRDGMNLASKEFIATRIDGKGVLILSEMAGAAKEMYESLLSNPNNIEDIALNIKKAINMPEEEQINRNSVLQDRLKNYTEAKWASYFIGGLSNVKKLQETKQTKKINEQIKDKIKNKFKKAKKSILFLDYDGTLSAFKKDPLEAAPDEDLYNMLSILSKLPNNDVVIISGRHKETLADWFSGSWNITIIAEHGVWTKMPVGDWEIMEQTKAEWKDIVRPYIEFYVDRTPGSFIEEKNYSLVWHYRKADPDLGNLRSWELKEEMLELITNHDLEIMDGDKVLEIKSAGINKGRAALNRMGETKYDFIFGIGDDWTDEYLFKDLPDDAITIKVGTKPTVAKYYVEGTEDVRPLLKSLYS